MNPTSFLCAVAALITLAMPVKATDTLTNFLIDLETAEISVAEKFARASSEILEDVNRADDLLRKSVKANIPNLRAHLRIQYKREKLLRELRLIDQKFQLELTRLRYTKGLEIIRLLYEKILALDHHFSSIQVQQQIAAVSNPHHYAAFRETEQHLSKAQKKDHAISLPAILQSNPYLSTTFSLITSVLGSDHPQKREEQLDEISCILDFTARMHSELSTIYYETEFLKQSNTDLRNTCASLFTEYMKVIGYNTPLEECRRNDDWEEVYDAIEQLFQTLGRAMESSLSEERSGLYRQVTDLEFSVDRLINFIDRYNSFINQGEKYYQKFLVIAETYPNQHDCQNELPAEFTQLKQDILQSISKFNEAYNISALRGSKLKDLLYGYDSPPSHHER